MGMDVYGKAPTSPGGGHFRNNVWWWRPLANLCLDLAPEVCEPCKHWHSNDGDGLGAEGAQTLGALLEAKIASGDVAAYVKAYEAAQAAAPDEPCDLCGTTGIRTDKIGRQDRQPERVITEPSDHPRLGQTGWCNGCNGKGWQDAWIKSYPLSVENVADFAVFLKASGGFSIC